MKSVVNPIFIQLLEEEKIQGVHTLVVEGINVG
jgi:hypothetical protein